MRQSEETTGAVLPSGLAHLRDLATALASAAAPPPGQQLRVWVTVPTSQLAAAAAALGATTALMDCTRCQHANLATGARVAVYADRKFRDAVLTECGPMLAYAGVRIPADRATVYRLPEAFPADRRSSHLDDAARARLASAYACRPDEAGHRHLAASAHPVVVVGDPTSYCADADTLAEATGCPQFAAHSQCGGIDQWFRHPVLTTGVRPTSLGPQSWLANVRPRLVGSLAVPSVVVSGARKPWEHCARRSQHGSGSGR